MSQDPNLRAWYGNDLPLQHMRTIDGVYARYTNRPTAKDGRNLHKGNSWKNENRFQMISGMSCIGQYKPRQVWPY